MSLDFRPAVADIKAALSAIPNIDIIDTHDNATTIGGVVKPYIVMTVGGPIRAARDRGLVGSKHDTNLIWVMLECVSNNIDVARGLKADAIEALVDFIPTDSGRLSLDGGSGYTLAQTSAVPLRFVENARLSCAHNLQWDETP